MIATIKVHGQTILDPASFALSSPESGIISAAIGALKRLPIVDGDTLDVVTEDGWFVGSVASVQLKGERVTIELRGIARV